MEQNNYRDFNRDYFNRLWSRNHSIYEAHPTSRHRRRFIISAIRKCKVDRNAFIFDYGCGSGVTLSMIKSMFSLDRNQLGGCDISEEALILAKERTNSEYLFLGEFADFDKRFAIAICSEVIEHTPKYKAILQYLYDNIVDGGYIILTTPHVPMDIPDEAYGHTQHFRIDELGRTLRNLGFGLVVSRRWGFPFFSLQKIITRCFYDSIEKHVISSTLTKSRKLIFDVAYNIYKLHDVINYGPQIFILAVKKS